MLVDLLQHFPAIWAVVGIGLASIAFSVGNRYLFKFQREANENLINTFKERIKTLSIERQEYKDGLHIERTEHQSSKLRLRELELKPDMTVVIESLRSHSDIMSGQSELMKAMIGGQSALEETLRITARGIQKLLGERGA